MILHFLITVLFIYGVHASTRKGMIFGGFSTWLYIRMHNLYGDYINDKKYPIALKITKVLFDCTPCMASVYGTISFFVYGSFPSPLLLDLAVWVFSLCGFNYILNKILNR